MCRKESVRVGDRVEIFQPAYLVGKVGLIQSREEVVFGQAGDPQGRSGSARWLVQVISDEFVVSLKLEEFHPCE